MCPKRKHWFATIHLQHCFPESVSQWRNVERPLCSLPDFECTQTGSCGSQPKIWVLGLYWLESLASLLQIYQVDSCDSCILTNQSGGFGWVATFFGFVGGGSLSEPFTIPVHRVFLASFAPWSSRFFQLPNCICVGSLQKPSSDTSNTKCFCGKISSKIQWYVFLHHQDKHIHDKQKFWRILAFWNIAFPFKDAFEDALERQDFLPECHVPVSLAAENAPCQVVRQRPAELRSWAKRIHESSSICTCSSLIHQTYPVHVCLIQVLSCFRRGVGMKKTPRSGWWLARILSHLVYSPRPVRIDYVKGDLIEYLYKDGRDSYMCTKWSQIASTCIKPSTQSITCCAYEAREDLLILQLELCIAMNWSCYELHDLPPLATIQLLPSKHKSGCP